MSYRIDAPAGWVQIAEPGEYRVAVTGGEGASQVELVVLRGAAQLMNDDGRTMLRAGERAVARAGEAPSYAYVYNSAAWDSFDRWSESRRSDRSGASAQYLPDTVQAYSSTFDQDGSWRVDVVYGRVWYPNVSVGWRPYFAGRWARYPGYGWTWIGTDRWAWPTHHYGRWGFSAGAWFWIPGRTWGPAWVSWAYAPGYTSWCPLGWDNRPVVRFGGYYGGHYNHWNAWTVVDSGHFGAGYVNASFVGASRIDVRTRQAFVVGGAAPQVRGYAVPRQVAPIRVAGSRGPVGYGYAGNDRAVTTGADGGRVAPYSGSRAARGSGGNAPRNAAPLTTGGDGRTNLGVGTARSRAVTGPEVIRGGIREQTTGVADRQSQTGSATVPGSPAPSRARRETPAAGQRTAAPRAFDPASVPVYRGGELSPAAPTQRAAGRQPDGLHTTPGSPGPSDTHPGRRRATGAAHLVERRSTPGAAARLPESVHWFARRPDRPHAGPGPRHAARIAAVRPGSIVRR